MLFILNIFSLVFKKPTLFLNTKIQSFLIKLIFKFYDEIYEDFTESLSEIGENYWNKKYSG